MTADGIVSGCQEAAGVGVRQLVGLRTSQGSLLADNSRKGQSRTRYVIH